MNTFEWIATGALLVPPAILFAGRGSKGGVYVWRANKPTATVGLPFIGRHFAYVGQTSVFALRERQHTGKPRPGDPYASTGASWSDLRPKCYRIPLPCHPKWIAKPLRLFVEWLLTMLLFPVYNARPKHPLNPRTITPHRAIAMRARRDAAKRFASGPRRAWNMLRSTRWYHWTTLAALGMGGWMWIS